MLPGASLYLTSSSTSWCNGSPEISAFEGAGVIF